MKKILILNGPNLNLLGLREPHIYGSTTHSELVTLCLNEANKLGLVAEVRQSNQEGELINWIQSARQEFDAIILNAGGLTHTSVALRDAVTAAAKPTIEVHLSNPHAREEFRHLSYLSGVCLGIICGLGPEGYLAALRALAARLA